MRPTYLSISAFASYAGKQEIDFDRLGTGGIYLVSGDTGAGKTTIFDAISFALYGEASGGGRESGMLRSKYAEEDLPTRVDLHFLYGGKAYRIRRNPAYMRPKKRGEGMVLEPADAELAYPDGRVVTGATNVSKAVEEIIGLDRGQFSQVAMIAQGDFRRLLDAETKDRQQIFRDLFRTAFYNKLQDRLSRDYHDQDRVCRDLKNQMDRTLSGAACPEGSALQVVLKEAKSGQLPYEEVVGLLDRLLTADGEERTQLEEEDKNVSGDLDLLLRKLDRQERVLAMKEQLVSEKKRLAELEAETSNRLRLWTERKEGMVREELLQKQALELEKDLTLYRELTEIKKEISDLDRSLVKLNQDAEEQAEAIRRDTDRRDRAENRIRALEKSPVARETVASALREAEEKLRNLTEDRSALERLRKLREDHDRAGRDYLHRKQEADRIRKEYLRLRTLYYDNQAGLLALGLIDGQACPVCGSTNHPRKAKPAQGAPDQDELAAKEDRFNRADEAMKLAADLANRIHGQMTALRDQLEKRLEGKKLEGDGLDREWLALAEKLSELKKEIGRLKKERENKEIEVKELEELKSYLEGAGKKLEGMKQEAADRLIRQTEEKTRRDRLEERAVKLEDGLCFADERAAMEEISRLKRTREKWIREREGAEADYRKLESMKVSAEGGIAQLESRLEEAPEEKLEDLKSRKVFLEGEKRKLATRLRENYRRLENNRQILADYQKDRARFVEEEAWRGQLNGLAMTAAGRLTGREKVMLETYIQMHYFDRVIGRANARLLRMTGNQYELVRRKEGDNLNRQSGLDLDVIDYFNGSVRSVKSLSGGESFKAALSLALGLADEIQSSAGGIQLDSLFIDEGFGSLDQTSLDQAIRTLIDLAGNRRLVGIISHVSELKQRIDKQIIVKKDPSGGSRADIVL